MEIILTNHAVEKNKLFLNFSRYYYNFEI
jgi:hypothetical protein